MSSTGKPAKAPNRTAKINLRVTPERLDVIDRGAKIRGLSRTDFILMHAQAAAEEAIVDQTCFQCDPEKFAAFVRALEAPPAPNEALKALRQRKTRWD